MVGWHTPLTSTARHDKEKAAAFWYLYAELNKTLLETYSAALLCSNVIP